MKKFGNAVLVSLLSFAPAVAFAQFGGINDFIGQIKTFINSTLIPLIIAVALLFFIWGMFNYFIKGGDDPDAQKKGTQLMMYAVIGFVAMVSIWGVVNLVANGLGFSQQQNIQNIPNVPTGNN